MPCGIVIVWRSTIAGWSRQSAAYFRGDHTLADQRTRQVLTVRPDDAEAWYHVCQCNAWQGFPPRPGLGRCA